MTNTGEDLDQISFMLPLDIKLMLQAILVPLIGRGRDRLAWLDNPGGGFDLKSAYSLANGSTHNSSFSAN